MRNFVASTCKRIAPGIVLIMFLSLVLPGCSAVPERTAAGDVRDVALSVRGFVDSTDGVLRVSGKGGLLLSLIRQTNPSAAPAGWELVAPVFDVTARDRQRRPLQQLASALSLRFRVAGDRPLTVLVHDGQMWQVVESEVNADGLLTASVDHLTPYTVGAPRGSGPTGATSATRTAPAMTRAAPTRAVSSTRTVPAQGTLQPNATTVVTPVSFADAQTALASAIKPLKGRSVKVTQASGYTSSLYVAVPPALQGSLGAALNAGGAGYYGLYTALNEAVTVQASGGSANGTLTLLIEPKTTMPTSADDAQAQLQTLFPGITAALTPVSMTSTATTTAYIFYGVSGNTAYSLGYVSYQGVPLAYAVAGSGSYQAFVPQQ